MFAPIIILHVNHYYQKRQGVFRGGFRGHAVATKGKERNMRSSTDEPSAAAGRHRGPPLLVVTAIYTALVLAGIIVPIVMAGGDHFPSPFDAEGSRWFAEHPRAALMSAFFAFCSAIPLGIFTATAVSRVQFLGMKVAGIHIALFGGFAAASALATSAFAAWVRAQPSILDAGSVAQALHLLAFAAGGPGYVVSFGLLVAGISLVAGLQGFLPSWLMKAGLVLAVIAELAVFAFVWPPALFLLPVARFLGLFWMFGVARLLPESRARVGTRHTAAPLPLDLVTGGGT
jgi:hypothetical protein